ncbi:exopolysaccharide biosynthesis polyprenyl glycosylphosphotransferase [Oceanihabitans sediminis]|uniref:Sugar transferase n=1 Tax=Oceanihabitans sediminis TaxID=1812012 RepID=A0A368P738_9FLAO|nr:sugar transferase [Oceanihabitans sediminis]RBP27178.1 exopolysaccharide biosynthesis polyprenyl glycosylphosphotransferase [Oceanihabitans sediminis]RCU57091.1 sugar transferase [Oceanihabitans sediminis]
MGKKRSVHFNISERKILLRTFDVFFVFLSLFIISESFAFDYFYVTEENWTWALVLAVYLSVFGTVFELYDLQKASRKDAVLSNILLTVSVTVLCYLLTPFFTPFLPANRLQILYFFLAIILGLTVWRLAYIGFVASPRFYKKALLVGDSCNVGKVLQELGSSDPNYKIVGFVNCGGEKPEEVFGLQEVVVKDIHEVIKKQQISEIVVSCYNSDTIHPDLYHHLIALLERGFPIKEYTQVYEEMTYRVPVQFVGKDFYKYFPFSRSNHNKLYLFFQRIFDLLFAVVGLLLAVFFLPFILFGNMLANRGPLFYKQERVGKNGKHFHILKFRTMVENAEKNGAVWASKNDARVTPFGRFMRRCRLDEVPQFYNILLGDMSFIGPRPERPSFVKELSEVIPFYETRHIIKPGLTGWAQVLVRYGASVEDSLLKLQYDLYYIKHRSFFLDAKIFLKTLSTVVYYRGQ